MSGGATSTNTRAAIGSGIMAATAASSQNNDAEVYFITNCIFYDTTSEYNNAAEDKAYGKCWSSWLCLFYYSQSRPAEGRRTKTCWYFHSPGVRPPKTQTHSTRRPLNRKPKLITLLHQNSKPNPFNLLPQSRLSTLFPQRIPNTRQSTSLKMRQSNSCLR